jgi:large subunit ribosomal protein L5
MSTSTQTTMPRLKARYRAEIMPELRERFGYENVMQIPGRSRSW